MSGLDEPARAAIEHACARLVAGYAVDADFGRFAEAAARYVDDGELEVAGKHYRGREAIRARLADKPAGEVSRHVVTNVMIDVLDRVTARGTAYVTAYRATASGAGPLPLDGPLLVGHYEDAFVATPDGWRFSRRRLVTTFRRR